MPRTGDMLDERYRLDALVATGGMGEVWRATDVTLGRLVAVKLLHPALLVDPQFDAMFQVEARIMAALTHPNVINIYDYGHAPAAAGGGPYLVMSYVDGQPLSRRIAEAGRLSVAETGSVLVQAAKALHATHTGGIIHCDVKPANLLITPDGTVILVDFGAARPTAVTAAEILGTALYMAPEQVTGDPVTPATDVYALGVVAYHCLAGRPPFTGKTPLQITLRHLSDKPPPLPPDVPPDLGRLITRAMNKAPAHRYPTAADFAAAVHRSLTTRGPTSPQTVDLPGRADVPGVPDGHGATWQRRPVPWRCCYSALAPRRWPVPPKPPATAAQPGPTEPNAPRPTASDSRRSTRRPVRSPPRTRVGTAVSDVGSKGYADFGQPRR